MSIYDVKRPAIVADCNLSCERDMACSFVSSGRNFDEVLRVIDSLQLTVKHKVATPVNWKNGEDVIIAGSVTDEDAKKQYPQGWRAPKPYIRIVPQPRA
jgi:hypothetical protein